MRWFTCAHAHCRHDMYVYNLNLARAKVKLKAGNSRVNQYTNSCLSKINNKLNMERHWRRPKYLAQNFLASVSKPNKEHLLSKQFQKIDIPVKMLNFSLYFYIKTNCVINL